MYKFVLSLPTPICWTDEASSLVEKSQKLRSDSQSLLDSSEEMINNHAEMILKQWQNTNERLYYRLEDYRTALQGLNAHLARVLKFYSFEFINYLHLCYSVY